MGNIISYLREYGYQTFRERPFSELDSLILSQLAYLKYDKILSEDEMAYRPALHEVSRHEYRESLFSDHRWEEENRILLEAAAASRRFGSMKLAFYINEVSESEQMQFSAVTFFLDNGFSYVAFRGTDESFVGWKEDFAMSFSESIPAQVKSVEYLQRYAPVLTGHFMVGGHSKGGNLAIYGACKVESEIQMRITDVYSHDGPGFMQGVILESEYELVQGRIRKTVPDSSIIGMLLYQREPYSVITSSQMGILQHDPFTWNVEDGEFVYKDHLKNIQIEFNDALNHWIEGLTPEQRKKFTESLYQVLMASGAKDLSDLTQNRQKSLNNMIGALSDIDGETRSLIWEVAKALLESLRLEIQDGGQNWVKEKKNLLKELINLK
ncbi:MAG: Mbeg1-like protein [Lachnospiraceae bacterium]